MKFLKFSLIILLLTVTACAKLTTVRARPGYEANLHAAKQVAILPVKAEVHMIGVGSAERMYDYEMNIENVVAHQLVTAFKENNLTAKIITRRDIHDLELVREAEQLRDGYNAEAKVIYASALMKEEDAYNIYKNYTDKNTSLLGNETNSDLLLLVDYSAHVKTNGARAAGFAMDVLLGGSSNASVDASNILLTIIDAKTGNFLWSNMGIVSKDMYSSAFENMTSSAEEADRKKVDKMAKIALSGLYKPEPKK